MPLPEPAATRSVLAPAPWSRWLWVGLAAVAALTALDVAVDRQVVLAGALAAVALAVGLLGHRGDALVIGAAALVAALGATAWDAGDATEQAIAIAVTATAGVTAFVTAVLRDAAAASARQFALLRGLAELADGASSVETTIDRVLDLLVPAVADVCALDLVIDHEQVRLGARVAGGEGGELEQALLRRRPAPRSVGAGTAQALRVQQSLLMDPITDELLTAVAATPEDLARLRAAGLRAALFLPLVARSRLLGAVSLVVGRSGRRYHEPDLRFGELLAGRIGIVLDNAGLSAQALEAERRLAAALDALGEAVTINDRDGRTVYANRAAAALLKVEDPEDLYGGEVGAISAAFAIYDEAGAPVPISAMPAFRALAGEPDPEPLLVRNVVKATGEERWLLNKVTVLRDGAGEPERVVNVIEDVTAVKRAERHQRLLAESTRALSRSLDPQRTLQHVAETAVPELADWCGVDLPGPGGAVDLVAMAHVDPERVALGRELRARYPLRMDDPTDLVRAMTEGVVVEIPSIRDEEVEALALDAEHLRLLRAIGFGAILIVPLVADGRSLGAMTLVRSDPVRPFTAADRRLAEELGQRAGIAVLNSRLYADRARVARELQRGLEPPRLPTMAGLTTATLYRPAGGLNEVGGDFYDAFAAPTGWMVVIGDVAGQGARAASLTGLARFTMRAVGQQTGDPLAVAAQLNRTLRDQDELSLCTAACLLLHRKGDALALTSVSCGHPMPVLLHDGGTTPIGTAGPLAGAFDDAQWTATTTILADADALVLYTDGVPDTVGVEERFGEGRLMRLLSGSETAAATVVAHVDEALRAFQHGAQRDDTAMVVLHVEDVAVALAGLPGDAAWIAPAR